ncbi:MAG: hypothetical protein AVDCRST_MAG26-4716, partial [uncultured Chloroflexia bacterium]
AGADRQPIRGRDRPGAPVAVHRLSARTTRPGLSTGNAGAAKAGPADDRVPAQERARAGSPAAALPAAHRYSGAANRAL